MKNYFRATYLWAMTHKIISVIVIIAVLGGGYMWYKSSASAAGKVSYITAAAVKGTLVTSISGSGQVSASDQIDLKSKVSETVTYVGVTNGQHVSAGTTLVAFNTTDAQKTVRNAQISLDNANLSLQKTESANTTIPLSQQQAKDNLVKAYSDGFTGISNTFLDLPAVMAGLDDILHGTEI
ncbi:MAG: hypothetical protein ACHQVK_01375, partial [Candidatus Paceibacterales bacterium]